MVMHASEWKLHANKICFNNSSFLHQPVLLSIFILLWSLSPCQTEFFSELHFPLKYALSMKYAVHIKGIFAFQLFFYKDAQDRPVWPLLSCLAPFLQHDSVLKMILKISKNSRYCFFFFFHSTALHLVFLNTKMHSVHSTALLFHSFFM